MSTNSKMSRAKNLKVHLEREITACATFDLQQMYEFGAEVTTNVWLGDKSFAKPESTILLMTGKGDEGILNNK